MIIFAKVKKATKISFKFVSPPSYNSWTRAYAKSQACVCTVDDIYFYDLFYRIRLHIITELYIPAPPPATPPPAPPPPTKPLGPYIRSPRPHPHHHPTPSPTTIHNHQTPPPSY